MKREKDQQISALQQLEIPQSLRMWLQDSSTWAGKSPTFEELDRQVYDLYSMPDDTWKAFQGLDRRISPSLDHYIAEARAFRDLDSKGKVRAYYEAELLGNHDPYSMINYKIGMPGDGVRTLYSRLLGISKRDDLRHDERDRVLTTMSFWEEAFIDVICDPETYFTKTATGNEGTASEFFGTSLSVYLSESPNMATGRYRDRLLAAVDYEGIVSGTYSRADFDPYYRQDFLLQLLYESQGTDHKLDPQFWRGIETNEHFIFTTHRIAVREHDPRVNELLVRAIDFAWRQSQETGLMYIFAAHHVLDEQFEGQMAADKFLADPEMRFEEKFGSSRSGITEEYLSDFQQLNDGHKDMVGILDSSRDGNVVKVQFVHIGDQYTEGSAVIDMESDTISGIEGEIGLKVLEVTKELESFKLAYLERLAS